MEIRLGTLDGNYFIHVPELNSVTS